MRLKIVNEKGDIRYEDWTVDWDKKDPAVNFAVLTSYGDSLGLKSRPYSGNSTMHFWYLDEDLTNAADNSFIFEAISMGKNEIIENWRGCILERPKRTRVHRGDLHPDWDRAPDDADFALYRALSGSWEFYVGDPRGHEGRIVGFSSCDHMKDLDDKTLGGIVRRPIVRRRPASTQRKLKSAYYSFSMDVQDDGYFMIDEDRIVSENPGSLAIVATESSDGKVAVLLPQEDGKYYELSLCGELFAVVCEKDRVPHLVKVLKDDSFCHHFSRKEGRRIAKAYAFKMSETKIKKKEEMDPLEHEVENQKKVVVRVNAYGGVDNDR